MTSETINIAPILELVGLVMPHTILDIGSGFGKFSILIREYLYSKRCEKGDYLPADDLIIDCVECAKYFQHLKFHEALYEHHFHDDVFNVNLDKYDLALLIDVVEHLTKEQYEELIIKLKKTISHIIISTPKKIHYYTEPYYGKDCPIHKFQLTLEDIKRFNSTKMVDMSTERSYVCLI